MDNLAMNKEWHRLNRMPPKATREQRIKWHAEHAQAAPSLKASDKRSKSW
jgi:hypothetical protein